MIKITEQLSNKFRNLSVLCAFFVVIIHCRPTFLQGGLAWYLKEFLQNGVCEMAVPFFFLASGFFVAPGIESRYKKEIIKRIHTLFLPYVLWTSMFLLYKMILTREFFMPSLGAIGLNPFRCPVLSPLWYVRALICLVLISPIILWGLRKKTTATLLIMLFVYVVVCPYYPMPHWDQLKWLARVGPIPVLGLFYFTVGMSIRLGILNGIVERVGNISPIVWMVLGIFFVIARAIAVDIGFGLLGAYCGFVSIPFLILFFWGVIPCVKGPNWLVFSSFPVFVIHKFFYLAVNNLVEKNTIYVYVLCFLSVFVLSLLMANVIRCVSPKICAFVFGGR